MKLLEPRGLWLLLGALPIVALYVLRTRRERAKVSAAWLWREAHRDALARAPWRRLTPELTLLMELLAVAALALAAARPVTRSVSLPGEHVAFVVDTSASMGATDASDGSRVAEAVRHAGAVLAGLEAGADVLVVEAASTPRLVLMPTQDRETVRRALATLAPRPVVGDLEAALALAADRLRAEGGRGRIVVLTDGALAKPVTHGPTDLAMTVLAAGTRAENVAIVRTEVGPEPSGDPSKAAALVVLRSYGERPADVTVQLTAFDAPGAFPTRAPTTLAERRVLVPAGQETALTIPFSPRPEDRGRALRIAIPRGDALAADDAAFARVPLDPRLPVILATDLEGSWLARALAADDTVVLRRLAVGQLARASIEDGALVVVEGACAEDVPAAAVLVVGPPQGRCFGVDVGAPIAPGAVVATNETDARLRYLTFDEVTVGRARPLATDRLHALVRAPSGTLVADASTPGRRISLVGFDLAESNWPLTASFVVFLRNVVEDARALRGGAGSVAARPGEAVRVAVPEGSREVVVTTPSGEKRTVPAQGGLAVLAGLEAPGVYRVRWREPRFGEAFVAVSLASADESAIAPRPFSVGDGAAGQAVDARSVYAEARGLAFATAAVSLALLLALLGTGPLRRDRRARGTLALAAAPGLLATLAYGIERAGLSATLPWRAALRFGVPWALVVAVLAPPLAWLFAQRTRALASPRRRAVFSAAAATLAGALAFALTEPEIAWPKDAFYVVLALDRSRSLDLVPGAEERLLLERRLAEASMGKDDRIATVVFGAEAAVEEPLRPRRDAPPSQRVEVPRDGTNLEAALRRSFAELPADVEGRIVLLTDGVATSGDAYAAAATALAADVPVDAVVLEQRGLANVRLASVRAPSRVDEGEAFDLRLGIESPRELDVEVRIAEDGSPPTSHRVHVRAGEDTVTLRRRVEGPGLHRYDVAITALDPSADQAPEDNALSAFVESAGPALALVLAGEPTQAAPLAAALRSAGLRVDVRGPAGMPADAGELVAFDLVVLMDIPARLLSPAQLDALAAYPRDLGGGLLLLGGDQALGPGGYARTPLEEVSPVAFDLREDKRRASLAEAILIDASGSMAATVGAQTKLALANEAAARSADLLSPRDRLTVAHVDDAVHVTVPMGPVTDRAAVQRTIRSAQVGGGGIFTDLALRAGYEALRREDVNLKHVLLFADGDDAERMAGCRALVTGAQREGITTSVISLGRGHDSPELEVLSRLGHGRFYIVEDAAKLPAVFAQETVLAARSALSDEPFHAQVAGASPALRGIAWEHAPALGGYVITQPKPRAAVALGTPEGDPLLATWSVGAGRAGVFTSDYEARWGKLWLPWEGGARLFGQLARELARHGADGQIVARARAEAGRLAVSATLVDASRTGWQRLTARVVGPDGHTRTAPLTTMGPGLLGADVPAGRPGTYAVALVDEAEGRVVASTAAFLREGEELRPTGSQRDELRRLTAVTTGVLRDTLAGLFRDRRGNRPTYFGLTGALAVLAGIGVVVLVGTRKLVVPTVRRLRPAASGRQPEAAVGLRETTARNPSAARAGTAQREPTGSEGAEPPAPPQDEGADPARPPAVAPVASRETTDAPGPSSAVAPASPAHDEGPRKRTAAEILAARRRGKN